MRNPLPDEPFRHLNPIVVDPATIDPFTRSSGHREGWTHDAAGLEPFPPSVDGCLGSGRLQTAELPWLPLVRPGPSPRG